MYIQSLKPAEGARTKYVRVGRGAGSGVGKTSRRGMKGRGFNNKRFAKVYSIVNVGDLEQFEPNTVITEELLYQTRIVGKMQPYGLKVLGNGELTKPLTVQAKHFTNSAKEKIEKAGGKIEVV